MSILLRKFTLAGYFILITDEKFHQAIGRSQITGGRDAKKWRWDIKWREVDGKKISEKKWNKREPAGRESGTLWRCGAVYADGYFDELNRWEIREQRERLEGGVEKMGEVVIWKEDEKRSWVDAIKIKDAALAICKIR